MANLRLSVHQWQVLETEVSLYIIYSVISRCLVSCVVDKSHTGCTVESLTSLG